jgi:hypothetical protein
MPPPTFIKILGNLKFMAAGLKLPNSEFKKPTTKDADKQYGQNAFQPADKIAVPSCIPPWFMPMEIPNKYYQDSCDKVGNNFKELHDTMIDAVSYAMTMWKLQAKFQNLQVMAVSAIGTPGCLDGPELESNIKNFPGAAAWSGNKAKYRDAVAKGVSKCFKNWQGQVAVPGLPWYPLGAAFPGPMMPPMPNIPMPLITSPSGMMGDVITSMSMKSAMIDALDGDLKNKDKDKQHEALFDAIATVVSLGFTMWIPMQIKSLIMGKGPVPTFAPPFVPLGPVVAGDNLALPGHMMA